MSTENTPATETNRDDSQNFEWEASESMPAGWRLPTHSDLPQADAKLGAANPQGELLSGSLEPFWQRHFPGRQYYVGRHSAIYWLLTSPRINGAITSDWFLVPDVPPLLYGEYRRSYVMWQEKKSPLLVLDFVSGSGAEARDDTPLEGKFWIYEQAVKASYYGIFDAKSESLELYRLEEGKYQRVAENERNRCPISELGIELGIWNGEYDNLKMPWLRLWDSDDNLLPHAAEQLTTQLQRTSQVESRARQELLRAETLAAQLRAFGIDAGAI